MEEMSIDLSCSPEILRLGQASHHGCNGPESYLLDEHWSLHLYDNAFCMHIDQERYSITPGMLTLVPPKVPMHFAYTKRKHQHSYCLFHSDHTQGALIPSPIFTLESHSLDCVRYLFKSAIHNHHHNTTRSACAIHEILWQLIGNKNIHNMSTVDQARHIIATQLNQNISVHALAQEVAISNNQLTRLFHKELGMTVIAYIRQERMLLAKRLIQKSSLPIKRIAQECGIFDLQYFNKTVRQFFHCSPRQLRESNR